ncbi:uncharacterized protein LOC116205818 [Punica granatum]|uniref:Uncharacterized protein LOC116205818 n=1 Tax=Punica granatum TaxID=22663 RepID=A0A6P8DIU7_PUNGR|nr:uncharacterized protein LOC116205818 [Punica granatum]
MAGEHPPTLPEEITSPTVAHSQPLVTHAPPPQTPVVIPPVPPPIASASSNSGDSARITTLEGIVNQLAANMATNMTELMALLRDQNRASSSYTPPPENKQTMDLNPAVPPTFVLESKEGMRLPPKIKILDFKRCDGTTDPRHHLRHYRSKMLSYWDYEEFVIQIFQDSLTGSALDWFMTLKAAEIPTWAGLSQKFFNQYRFCMKTPPTLLDLSMMEMRKSQTFETYAAEW